MVEVDRKFLPGILGLEVGRIDRPRGDHGAGRLAVGARAADSERDAGAEGSGQRLHLEPGRESMQPVGQGADHGAGGDLQRPLFDAAGLELQLDRFPLRGPFVVDQFDVAVCLVDDEL